MTSRLISVGIPTYNRVGLLKRAALSVLSQDYPNLEVIISDNASTDATQDFCKAVCQMDERVRYIRQPVNLGHVGNFRAVLEDARGEYFMWLADDDWLDSADYLSQCAEALTAHADYSLVGGRGRYFNDDEFALEEVPFNLMQDDRRERVVDFFRRVGANAIFHGLMRREQISSSYFQHLLGGDWLLVAKMAFTGKVKTLESISLNRALGGESADLRKLALGFGATTLQARYPNYTIALYAFRDIAWRSAIYRCESFPGRLTLAMRAWATTSVKYTKLPYYHWQYRVLKGKVFNKYHSWYKRLRA